MSKPKIAIIIGSTRDSRFGDKPAKWVHEFASARDDIDIEIVDLKDWPLPFFNEVASNAWSRRRTKSASAGRRRSPNSTATSS